jgi:hypothetical protein
MGLHVQLDVEYASDERIVEAGPMAELLYVRALCWCKKNPKTNGAFTWSQLAVFAHAIPQARKHAARLVEVGAWEATDRGAQVAAWLKRNKSGEDIASAADMASMLGIQGNHERWHVGKEGKPSNKCPLCLATFKASGTPIGSMSGNPIGSSSPKEEVKEEEESQVEEEVEVKPKEEVGHHLAARQLESVPPLPADDDELRMAKKITEIIDAIIGQRATETGRRISDPIAYLRSGRAKFARDERLSFDMMLVARPHFLDDDVKPETAAAFYLASSYSKGGAA